MKPCLKPQLSSTTLTTGTRQFVVHDAFEITRCFAGSYFWWFTPITIVMSSPLAGAELTTFLAPAVGRLAAPPRSGERPGGSRPGPTPGVVPCAAAAPPSPRTLPGPPLTPRGSPPRPPH